MAKKTGVNGMSFTQACEYLGVSPDQLVMLRNRGLVACLSKEKQTGLSQNRIGHHSTATQTRPGAELEI